MKTIALTYDRYDNNNNDMQPAEVRRPHMATTAVEHQRFNDDYLHPAEDDDDYDGNGHLYSPQRRTDHDDNDTHLLKRRRPHKMQADQDFAC